MNIWGYKSPQVAVNEFSALLGSNKNSRILDVCAGTGMTGQFVSTADYLSFERLAYIYC